MASSFPTRTSVLGVDLTGAGAPTQWQRDRDPETESFIMARLAGLAKLLDAAGADLITLDSSFRLGGRRRRDDWLDGALALSRLGSQTRAVSFAAAVPLTATTPSSVAAAIASVHRATGARGGWQVETSGTRPAGVDAVVAGLKGPGASPTVVVEVTSDIDVEIAAARGDVARLAVPTVEEARNLRSVIRAAAQDWGRQPSDVRVLVDISTVLAPHAEEASARAEFLTDVQGPAPSGQLRHVGTVAGLVSLWANWVRAGAADGFTILPASIPTDVIAVAQELLPELERRGLRSAPARPLVPARRRPAPVAA